MSELIVGCVVMFRFFESVRFLLLLFSSSHPWSHFHAMYTFRFNRSACTCRGRGTTRENDHTYTFGIYLVRLFVVNSLHDVLEKRERAAARSFSLCSM